MGPEQNQSVENQNNSEIQLQISKYLESDFFKTNFDNVNTKSAYKTDLKELERFCTQHGFASLSHLNGNTISNLIAEMENDGYAKATMARRIEGLKGFFDWAVNEKILPEIYIENLPKIIVPANEKPQVNLTINQQESLIGVSRKNMQNHALVLVLLQTGAKISEVLSRDVKHVINKNDNCQIIFNNKDGKERNIELDNYASEVLKTYILASGKKLYQPLFTTNNFRNQRLHRREAWVILKGYGRQIGIENLNSTTLRNTFIANFKGNSEQLSNKLGNSHKNVDKRKKLMDLY